MEDGQIYFIGLLPPGHIRNEIIRFKEYFRDQYGVTHALKSPPHITLVPPFKWNESNEQPLFRNLQAFAFSEKPFSIKLENFGAFPPGVIFVDVLNNKNLEDLHIRLTDYLKNKCNMAMENNTRNRFKPHISIAFKDLHKEQFHDAWPEFQAKKIKYDFNADGLTVLKHSGKQWNIHFFASFA